MQTPRSDGRANGLRGVHTGSSGDASSHRPTHASRPRRGPGRPHAQPSLEPCAPRRTKARHRVSSRTGRALGSTPPRSSERVPGEHPRRILSKPRRDSPEGAPGVRQHATHGAVCRTVSYIPGDVWRATGAPSPSCAGSRTNASGYTRCPAHDVPPEKHFRPCGVSARRGSASARRSRPEPLCTPRATRDYYVLHEKLRCPRTTPECQHGSA